MNNVVFFCAGQLRVRLDLLRLIKWKDEFGTIQRLDLCSVLSSIWDRVSDQLMIDQYTRQSIERKKQGDPEKCLREVIELWLRDEKALSPNYPCTWNGLSLLLVDVKLSSASEDLRAALEADVSSFNNNIIEGGMLAMIDFN